MRFPRLVCALGLLLGTIACGRGGQKQGPTSPAGGGSMLDSGPAQAQGNTASAGPNDPATTPPTGPVDEWAELAPVVADHKPPGADLPPEERKKIISDQLSVARDALKAGDADRAIAAALKVLDADETNDEAMILLADGYYRRGFYDKAEYILTLARRQQGAEQNPRLWMLLGLVAAKDDEREDSALAAYEKASELKGDYSAAIINKGAIYLKRRRYDDAVVAFERASKLQANSPLVRTNLGSAYRGKAVLSATDAATRDDYLKRAEREFKAAIKLDPQFAAAYFNLGLLYLDADNFPGMEPVPRLEAAKRNLAEYKKIRGGDLKKKDPVEDHMAAAEGNIVKEQKRDEARKKREERDRKQKERDAQKAKDAAKKAKDAPADAGNKPAPATDTGGKTDEGKGQ